MRGLLSLGGCKVGQDSSISHFQSSSSSHSRRGPLRRSSARDNAALVSSKATLRGCLNSRCNSDRSRRARIPSLVDLAAVHPD